MNGNQKPTDGKSAAGDASGEKGLENEPGWADGLRQLYDSVVNEPLPDNFKDLLSKLDDQE